MATDQTTAPPPTDAPPAPPAETNASEEDETRTRLPRVVVRMSDAMKEALDVYVKEHPDVVPTALARQLLADYIKFDLSKDPDAPGTGTRQKYTDDASRDAGKLRNRKKSSLLRKALFQVHHAQLKRKPLLQAEAFKVVQGLADDKITSTQLDLLDVALDAAIKAGK